MLKGRWYISWFKNPHGVVSLPNQPNLFLILELLIPLSWKIQTMHLYIFFITFFDKLTYMVIFLNTAWGS